MMQLHAMVDCHDPTNSKKGTSGPRYYKEPNVPEGFAESSLCGSIRPWNCPVTLSNTALISHHTITRESRQSPRSHSSGRMMQAHAINDCHDPTNLKKKHPGPELIRNHQTYRKGLQRAPLVGASGLGIVLSHQTNLALISRHTMTREPRQSPRRNSSRKNDATACNR